HYTLSVSVTGEGTITSSPVDATGKPMNCSAGSSCVQPYFQDETVTLIGQSRSTKVGSWGGDCTVTIDPGRATVNMDSAAMNCTATFIAKDKYDLSVTLAGTGEGRVTSSPVSANATFL